MPAAQKKKTATKAKDKATLTVEQVASGIRRPKNQRAGLVALGLGKIGRRRQFADTPEIRSHVARLAHMVRIVGED